ncbi:MAG: tRNA (guanosine(46)-N7)-methyltransferase TrmB [Methylococcales bacterium]|nr:tRNA (guanosine(46)-N7)-methyltransferase TrmB [Methylococcales bacterium]
MDTPEKEKESYPRIRSFSLRQGRATAGQAKAFEKNWDRYCLDPEKTYNYAEVFSRDAPIIIEIGFGNGSSLADMAEANPDLNYIGIEVHRPGVGHLMLLLEQKGLNNVRVYHHDAIEILEQKIADNSLAGVHLFFPDPWHKRKHHKRRIVRPSFTVLLTKKLKSGGYFHAATDWEHYAKDMLKILSSATGLINTSEDKQYCPRPNYRPLTKFESRGLRLGHGVWDLIFKKI